MRERLRRLLMNEAIEPSQLYAPVAGFLLSCFSGGRVRLILEATDLGGRLPVLFVAVAYRGRALPLGWRMLPAMGCSEFTEQKALLSEVAALVPPSSGRACAALKWPRLCRPQVAALVPPSSGRACAALSGGDAAGRPRVWQRGDDPLVPFAWLALLSARHPNKTLRKIAGCFAPMA